MELNKRVIFNPKGDKELTLRKMIGGNSTGLNDFNNIKYSWTSQWYRQAMNNFWIPEEINLSQDVKDYRNLDKEEKTAYDKVLSFLVFLDSVQTSNLPSVSDYITANEVNLCLNIQTFQEAVHCFTEGHEILTSKGFIPFNKVTKEDKIATVAANLDVEYYNPTDIIVSQYEGEVIEFKHDYFHQVVTPSHNIPLIEKGYENITHIIRAEELLDWKFAGGFNFISKADLDWKEDVHSLLYVIYKYLQLNNTKKDDNGYYKITNFNLKNFIDYAELDNLNNIEYTYKNKKIKSFYISNIKGFEDAYKRSILYYSSYLSNFILALDGTKITKEAFDFIKKVCYNTEYKVFLANDKLLVKQENFGFIEGEKININTIPYKGKIYCVTVPNNVIIVRYNNIISVSGNSQSYSYMLDTICSPEERDSIIYQWREDEHLLKRNEYIGNIYNDFQKDRSVYQFLRTCVANYVLEGIYFYSGFMFFYNLGRNGKMPGSVQEIRYINRDENTHLWLFRNILRELQREHPELFTEEAVNEFRRLIKEGAEQEIAWGKYVLGNRIEGLTENMIESYIKYLANQRCKDLGFSIIFAGYEEEPDSMKWVSQYADINGTKTDFFEAKPSAYSKASAIEDDL